jgi:hypothetical protein
LRRHGRSCPSGSGDRNFVWLNELIETSWYDRSFARQPRPAPKQIRNHEWLDEHDAEEQTQGVGRRATFTARFPNRDSEPVSLRPDCIALRQKAVGAFPPTRDTKSPSPQEIPQPQPSASSLSGQRVAPSAKKIDIAADWLRAQLATGYKLFLVSVITCSNAPTAI